MPLLEVRRVKPLLLIRGVDALPGAAAAALVDATVGCAARWRASTGRRSAPRVVVSAALVGVAGWQAASLRVGAIVSIGFAGVALVLHLAGVRAGRAVRPLALRAWFPLRHAVLGSAARATRRA